MGLEKQQMDLETHPMATGGLPTGLEIHQMATEILMVSWTHHRHNPLTGYQDCI